MSLYLSNGASLKLEDKTEVVGDWILFKISFGWGKMDEVCESYAWSKFS